MIRSLLVALCLAFAGALAILAVLFLGSSESLWALALTGLLGIAAEGLCRPSGRAKPTGEPAVARDHAQEARHAVLEP